MYRQVMFTCVTSRALPPVAVHNLGGNRPLPVMRLSVTATVTTTTCGSRRIIKVVSYKNKVTVNETRKLLLNRINIISSCEPLPANTSSTSYVICWYCTFIKKNNVSDWIGIGRSSKCLVSDRIGSEKIVSLHT